MRETKKKSSIPIYGVAAAWVLYCLVFPLYRTWHFLVLAGVAALVYLILSAIFPGKTEFIEVAEEPKQTGDKEIDALLAEGGRAVTEMRALREAIPDQHILQKLDSIIAVTDKIFNKLFDDRSDYKQVRRFADYYLPTTVKLLHTYDRFGKSGITGENITGTQERIDKALDMILDSYNRFFDSLFQDQALDIETDIKVLESVLK